MLCAILQRILVEVVVPVHVSKQALDSVKVLCMPEDYLHYATRS